MTRRNVAAPELILRPWHVGDAPGLRKAIDEDLDHLRPWLTWTLEEPASLEQTRLRLARHAAQFRAGRALRHAITPAADSSTILGGANLYVHEAPGARGVGYWVRRSATRKGIAGAAVSALVLEAFRDATVDRVTLQCDTANAVSATFALRLGFMLVGELLHSYPDGSPRPVLDLAMTRSRFLKGCGPALRVRAQRVRITA